MQDEITKHSKKAIKIMKNADHSLVEKIKEIGIEIFIIVFAVSFSIWLHTWSEHRHQQQEVKEFLTDLKEDLNSDIESQIDAKNNYLKTIENFNYITNLSEAKYDSLSGGKDSTFFKTNLSIKLNSFPNIYYKSRSGNYEGFKSSGKIGFIENKKLKKLILEYYEHLGPGISLQSEIIRQYIIKCSDLMNDFEGNGKKMVFNKKVQSYLLILIAMSNGNEKNYEGMTKFAREILAEVDKDALK
jgi:hypothetical protein